MSLKAKEYELKISLWKGLKTFIIVDVISVLSIWALSLPSEDITNLSIKSAFVGIAYAGLNYWKNK